MNAPRPLALALACPSCGTANPEGRRGAMRPGSKLLIVERLVPEGNEPSEAKLFDVNILVVLGGLERTKTEYGNILDEASFDLARVIPTAVPASILEGAPRSV